MEFKRYVAIGDSSTEGLDDPDGTGGFRGWADRLAEHVARQQSHPLEYANLAVRGRLAAAIRAEQLDIAVALKPDLSSVVGGMNDLLRPKFDARIVVGELHAMFKALSDVGSTVVTFTLPRPGPGMPLAKLLRPRVSRYNETLRSAARHAGVLVLDLEAIPVSSDPRLWSDDKLHANSLGHERIAAGLAQTIGLSGVDTSWSHPLPPLVRTPLSVAVRNDFAWSKTHLAPWVRRHLRGESSGDSVEAKRPIPTPVFIDG